MRLRLMAAVTGLLFSISFIRPLHGLTSIDLSGAGWIFHSTLDETKHPVTVPHCWPVMKGYEKYIGDAVYERDFDAPALPAGKVARLHFDAVYYKAHVWVNGEFAGAHEGGYSQFEFDVTKMLKPGKNHVVVEVDNTPTLTSIPAIATAANSGSSAPLYGTITNDGIVGWWPYGGIVRPVHLVISDGTYLRVMKIDAKPDLAKHTARITVRAVVHNAGDATATPQMTGSVAGLTPSFKRVRIGPGGEAEVTWSGTLQMPHLWSVRDPYLYDATLTVGDTTLVARIGVRELRVEGSQLLLNGRPVHLYGANRVSEDPAEGLRESSEIVNRDMTDMLADNMRMMRIAHYPQVQAVLDFADEHGHADHPGSGQLEHERMADGRSEHSCPLEGADEGDDGAGLESSLGRGMERRERVRVGDTAGHKLDSRYA